MTKSLAAACGLMMGCQGILGLEISPPPSEGDDRSQVAASGVIIPGGVAPESSGQVVVLWPVFASDGPDSIVLFGRGSADAAGFDLAIDERPPDSAFVSDAGGALFFAVGFVFAYPDAATLPPDGPIADLELPSSAYASSPRHAILFEEAADDPQYPWEQLFEPGYSCAVCSVGPAETEEWRPTPCTNLEMISGATDDQPFCQFAADQ